MEIPGAFVGRGELAARGAPARRDRQGLAEGLDLARDVPPGLRHGGEVEPESREEREPPDGPGRQVLRGVKIADRDRLADQGHPGVPEVGPGLPGAAERGQQLLRVEDARGPAGEGGQPVAEGDLAGQLGFDEREGLDPLGPGVAGVDQAGDGEVVVDRPADCLAERLLRLAGAPGLEQQRAPDRRLAGAGGLEVAGHPHRVERLVDPALLREEDGELAMGPGVGRVDREDLADDRLGGGGAVVLQPAAPELVEGEVVREPPGGPPEVLQRLGAAFGLGQEPGDGGIGVEGRRLGVEHLTPEPEGLERPPLGRGERRGGPEPCLAAREPLGPGEPLGRAVELAVLAVRLGDEEEQLAVDGPEPERLVEHLERLGHPLEEAEGPVERPVRPARLRPEPPGPGIEEVQGLLGLPQVPGGQEIGAGEPFVLVVEAGGDPVELERIGELAPVPRDVGLEVDAGVVERPGLQDLRDQLEHGRVLSGVGHQLLGILAEEQGVRAGARAEVLEQGQALVAAGEVAEGAELAEQEVRVVGVEGEQAIEGVEQLAHVGVVPRQESAPLVGEPGVGGFEPHRLVGLRGAGAVVLAEGALHGEEVIVEGRLGELEPVEPVGLRRAGRAPCRAGRSSRWRSSRPSANASPELGMLGSRIRIVPRRAS